MGVSVEIDGWERRMITTILEVDVTIKVVSLALKWRLKDVEIRTDSTTTHSSFWDEYV